LVLDWTADDFDEDSETDVAMLTEVLLAEVELAELTRVTDDTVAELVEALLLVLLDLTGELTGLLADELLTAEETTALELVYGLRVGIVTIEVETVLLLETLTGLEAALLDELSTTELAVDGLIDEIVTMLNGVLVTTLAELDEREGVETADETGAEIVVFTVDDAMLTDEAADLVLRLPVLVALEV